jgi:hypothetical protein
MGKFVAAQGGGAAPTLKGLPGGSFLLAGAAKWDSASVTKIVDDFSKKLLADPDVAKAPNVAVLTKGLDDITQLMAITRGMSVVLLDPPAGGKDGIFCGAALVDTTDPKKYMALESDMLQSNFAQVMNPNVKQTTTITPDSVTIGEDVKLSKVTMKMDVQVPAGAAGGMQQEIQGAAKQMIDKMYGPEGMTMYIGVVGQKVIVIYGSDHGTMEAAVAAAKANSEPLATEPGIKATRDQVVANPVSFMYLPVTRWVTLGQAIAIPAQPGAAPPPANPVINNAPPGVLSVGVTGTQMSLETHVPIATILGVQEAVKRIQDAMAGPGAGGAAPAIP